MACCFYYMYCQHYWILVTQKVVLVHICMCPPTPLWVTHLPP